MSVVFREIKWKTLIFAIAATAAIMKFSFVYKCSYALVTDVIKVVETFNVSIR